MGSNSLVSAMNKDMVGLEFIHGDDRRDAAARFDGRYLGGAGWSRPRREEVVVAATPNDTQLDPHGTVHGGLAATMLDSCMGLAVMTLLKSRASARTIAT